jgi:hypothetical protein
VIGGALELEADALVQLLARDRSEHLEVATPDLGIPGGVGLWAGDAPKAALGSRPPSTSGASIRIDAGIV